MEKTTITCVANITAAIATLDRPEGLVRCLDALLAGDVLPAEVIVVDQSHDDETRSLVAQREVSGVRIIYVRQHRRGLSASRNAALTHASCPVLAVTDDDCVPDRTWISVIDRAFSALDAPDALTGRVLPMAPAGPNLYAVSTRSSPIRVEFTGKSLPWLIGTGGNLAVTRTWFGRIGLYDERLGTGSPGGGGEDMDMFYRLVRAGARVRYEPDLLIYHERQSKARRIATRSSYGRGIGGFCGIWIRRGDVYALSILGRWLFNHAWALAGALRRRQWTSAFEESLILRGTFKGLVYGLRAV